MKCPECGGINPNPFRFCGHCAAELPRPEALADPEAERRQLTVMFCDLAGSTGLSGQLDVEQLRELVRQYQIVCVDAIERYGGHVAQYLGDGVLAYFGYPQAHDDDVQRSIHAGLAIAAAVPLLEFELPLAVRIGLHTGLTVTGEVGGGKHRERLALGETPNIAARLQSLAQPNTVVISGDSRVLAGAVFEYESLGLKSLNGVTRPIEAFKVVRKIVVRSRFQACHEGGAMRFVGRSDELARLRDHYSRAREGGERTVLVEGQAGIGKSRLVHALYEELDPDHHLSIAGQCAEYERNTVLFPLSSALSVLAGFVADDTPAGKLDKLEALLNGFGCQRDETFAFLADLLGLPYDARNEPAGGAAELRRLRTLQAVLQVIRRASLLRPVVFVIEDLHWADPTTLELLRLLVEQPGEARVLTILTFRPEHEPAFAPGAAVDRIRLAGLAPEVVETLLHVVTEGKPLPPEVVRAVVDKSDGVPLFVEELTRSLIDSGAVRECEGRYRLGVPLAELEIPANLQASLTTRLDRLGRAKEVAQLGAVLGRRFDLDLMKAASSLDAAQLQSELDTLVEAELVEPGDSAYEFRHALIRDTAYASMLASTRQRHHRRIAGVLEGLRPEHRHARPELLAHHWSQGGVHDKAAPMFRRAGERAAALYANDEAVSFLRSGIREVRAILLGSESSESWLEQYCAMQESIADVSVLVRRHDEARAALRQALAQAPDNAPLHEARLHRKLGKIYVERREPVAAARAFDMAEAALGPEPAQPETAWRHEWVDIQLARNWMHYWQGQGEPMQALIERVGPYIADNTPARQRADFYYQRVLSGFRRERYAMSRETLAHALAFLQAVEQTADIAEQASAIFTCGFVMLFKGDLDDAEVMLQRALAAARKSGNKTIEIRILTYMTVLYRRRDEPERVREYGDVALKEATAAGAAEYVGLIEGNFAWSAYREGDLAATEEHGRVALEQFEKTRISYPLRWTALLPLLAVSHRRGQEDRVGEHLRGMLGDDQQQLPEPLWSELRRALAAFESGGGAVAMQHAGAALAISLKLGYINLARADERFR